MLAVPANFYAAGIDCADGLPSVGPWHICFAGKREGGPIGMQAAGHAVPGHALEWWRELMETIRSRTPV